MHYTFFNFAYNFDKTEKFFEKFRELTILALNLLFWKCNGQKSCSVVRL